MNNYSFLFLVAVLSSVLGANAIQHRVRVYARKTGFDAGAYVELRTRVTAYYTNPVSSSFITQDKSVLENRDFSSPGISIFDYSFKPGSKVLSSLKFQVDEMDGSTATMLCELRVTPLSWPTGSSSYQCYYESDNGTAVQWHFNIVVNTCVNNFAVCPSIFKSTFS